MVEILDHPGFYLIRFIYTCYFFLTHLPLHLLLAIHEYLLYRSFNLFHEMCSWTLRATVHEGTLAKSLPEAMGAVQGAFGFFLLVDITLMLIYWLLHTYHAYFTFQVILKGMNNFLSSSFILFVFRRVSCLLQALPWSYWLSSPGYSCWPTQAQSIDYRLFCSLIKPPMKHSIFQKVYRRREIYHK